MQNMLKNMKIKKSLILGFGITLVVSVAIIIVSIIMMNTQRSAYTDIINNEIEANLLVTEIRLDAQIAARNVREMALDPTSSDNRDLENNANSMLNDMNTKLSRLREIYPLNDNKLDAYVKAINDWGNVIPSITTAIDRGNGEEATRLIKNTCSPLLSTMYDAGTAVDEALTSAQESAIEQQRKSSLYGMVVIVAVMFVATLFVLYMATKLIRGIVEPTEQVRKALAGFSEGKLDIPVYYEGQNELGQMCDALRTSQKVLNGVISDECRLLEEMARGNFDVSTKDEKMYVGALSSVLQSIRVINHNLSDTLAQIDLSAEQVTSGSEQVSTGAQALAQGATEQASAVQELSATIAEISTNSQNNAKNSEKAMEHSKNAGDQVAESAKYMEEMVVAMNEISQSSQEIGKIIATIENIAFQTNILALNAAVEAARAGSAGKGFAVVADEVRNLATKSDQAAKATKDLIDRSVSSVENGNEIVQKVSASLSKTVEASEETMSAIMEIAKAADEEAEAIAQVTEGIDQISSVVQTNSATSEQSAAASEELSSQASLMKELMAKFRLRNADDSYSSSIGSSSSYRSSSMMDDDMGMPASSAASAFSKY